MNVCPEGVAYDSYDNETDRVICFSMLQSLINQTQPEEWFLSHENGLEGCGTLRALSTT